MAKRKNLPKIADRVDGLLDDIRAAFRRAVYLEELLGVVLDSIEDDLKQHRIGIAGANGVREFKSRLRDWRKQLREWPGDDADNGGAVQVVFDQPEPDAAEPQNVTEAVLQYGTNTWLGKTEDAADPDNWSHGHAPGGCVNCGGKPEDGHGDAEPEPQTE